MDLRLRIIGDQEAHETSEFVIPVIRTGYPEERAFAILEYEYGSGSAEGPSWTPVKIYNDL